MDASSFNFVDPRVLEKAVNTCESTQQAESTPWPNDRAATFPFADFLDSPTCDIQAQLHCSIGANGSSDHVSSPFNVDHDCVLGTKLCQTFSPSLQDSETYLQSLPTWNIDKDTELFQATTQSLEHARDPANLFSNLHIKQRVGPSNSDQQLVSRMSSSPQPPFIASHSRGYSKFRGTFQSSDHARQYRKIALRFDRKPYQYPDVDETIHDLVRNRQYHIKRIYDAMVRPDVAQDNPGSIAMRRWVHNAYYDSDMVEAFSNKVFDCLIKQTEEGFRGWHHNDYASDERKGSETEDKNLNCAERLDSVIHSLEREKTICEDIMNSACQIRMFVNAPRAYAVRKSANRAGNSKRKKATEPDRVSKSRSTRVKRSHSRSTVTNSTIYDTPSSSSQCPRPLEMPPQPSDITEYRFSPDALPSAYIGFVPATGGIQPHITLSMSPPDHGQAFPQFPSAQPLQHAQFISTAPGSSHSATLTVDPKLLELNYNVLESPWNANADECPKLPTPDRIPLGPALFQPDHTGTADPTIEQSFDLYNSLPNSLPDIVPVNMGEQPAVPDFQTFWLSQTGVQPFPSGSEEKRSNC
ncbi:hypothetical protein BU24DRAFT_477249 [Aaosphaeria arxii CBS 175.79]|uniref:Uncharacterized protein n=1 Tax=Aaosphaeria arxii CBS 175.79 TaxID=1450172 RepID=A0A6A5Y4C6_9PLEO|nr:uncharacterized protein BU24DRAFT_477249 [Aaosphaeria arxii CBS 175.79]KAF2020106.1 hypothetical protein BU24DRAFT_477249 [Aaosphaeria arxii CBS 175.79]